MVKNPTDEFSSRQFAKKMDALETFKKEFEGTQFYEKVADAIDKSKVVEEAISKIVWTTVKNRIVWIILGCLGVVLTDLVIRAIPNILSAISGHG